MQCLDPAVDLGVNVVEPGLVRGDQADRPDCSHKGLALDHLRPHADELLLAAGDTHRRTTLDSRGTR